MRTHAGRELPSRLLSAPCRLTPTRGTASRDASGTARRLRQRVIAWRRECAPPEHRQRTAANGIDANGDHADRDPVDGRWPFAKNGNAHEGGHGGVATQRRPRRRWRQKADHAPVEQEGDDGGQDTLNDGLKRNIRRRSLEHAGAGNERVDGQIEHKGANGCNGSGMEAVEPGAAHRDSVTGPNEPGGQEKRVANVLRRANGASRDANDANGAEHNQGKPHCLLWRESLLEDRRRQERHHQGHHTGTERAPMSSWSEQQAGIDQQNHGCSAAKDNRTNADPA